LIIKTFSVGDRVNLIESAFELAYSVNKSYIIPAKFSTYFETIEDSYTVWKTLFFHTDRLAFIIERRESFRSLRVSFNLVYKCKNVNKNCVFTFLILKKEFLISNYKWENISIEFGHLVELDNSH
jgi:hypothetical protein